jgi:hypothetical protein
LEEQFDDTTSPFAEEGTLAHSMGELIIRRKELKMPKLSFDKKHLEYMLSSYYSQALFEYAEAYALYVIETLHNARKHTKDAALFLEERLDMSEWVPEGFGTADAIIVADGVLDFIDLKYGKGVPVSAVENKQLMVYALGAIWRFGLAYDIHTVRMTIFQPRLDSISTWEITVDELMDWAEEVLKPGAKKAFAGEGGFVPGSHCQFCKAKATCKANADMHTATTSQVFDDVESAPVELLSDEQIADILSKSSGIKNWLTAVEEYALNKALDGGEIPGYKLVEGRSNRVFTSEEAVEAALKSEGFPDDMIYTKKLLGIGAMEKNLGKPDFKRLLDPFVEKPAGKPTLVPMSDKRDAIVLDKDKAAKDAFD